jgi:hypothetical protein
VTLSWSAPAVGGDVTTYRVRLGRAAGATETSIDSGPGTTLAMNTLAPGVWFARVLAVGVVGAGPVSNEVSFTVADGTSAPRNLAVAVTGLSVTFTWDAPPSGAVTGYIVEVGSAAGLSDVIVVPVGMTTTVTAPAPPGTYFARVKALNGSTESAASNEVSFTTATGVSTPGAPLNLTATVSGSSVTLAWSPPITGGAPLRYFVEAGTSTGASNVGTFAVGGTSMSVPVVPSGTFFVRVKADNAAGTGPASSEVSFTVGGGSPGPAPGPGPGPTLPPGAPSGLAVTVSGSTVGLTWLAPTTGGAPEGYAIQVGSASGLANLGTFAVGPTTAFSASGIPPGTFFVRVFAVNTAGPSSASNEVTVVVP